MTSTPAVSPFRRRDVQKWLAAGLLIRLVLMPLATHSDLLSVYQRAHLLLSRSSSELSPNILNSLHTGFLWLIRPLVPYQMIWGSIQATTLEVSEWLGFINAPSVFRTLFLLKLPYLGFELLAIWMLLRLVDQERVGRVAAFWMLNPIVIFSTYVFGRFDIIIVWLLLTALFFARQERSTLALLVLGVASLVRVYPIILVLPFAFILRTDWIGRLRLMVLGGLPLLLSIFMGASSAQLGTVRDFGGMPHLEYPLAMKFFLYGQDNLYVFVFLYALIIMYLYLHPQHDFEALKRFCLYIMLTFFATSFFHPHYLIWLIPFAAFYIDVPRFLPLHGVQIGGWIVYTFQWGRSLAGYLIAPFSPAFFWSLNSPGEWIGQFYPADQLVGLGRSVFSAACLALAYVVWKQAGGALQKALVAKRAVIEEIAEDGSA